MNSKTILQRTLLVTTVVVFAIGCTPAGESKSADTVSAISPTNAECIPVRVAIFQDKSGSTNWTGTPTLKVEDVEPLVDLLSYCGGELGFGLISDNSNRGLIRLIIDPQPMKPVE